MYLAQFITDSYCFDKQPLDEGCFRFSIHKKMFIYEAVLIVTKYNDDDYFKHLPVNIQGQFYKGDRLNIECFDLFY